MNIVYEICTLNLINRQGQKNSTSLTNKHWTRVYPLVLKYTGAGTQVLTKRLCVQFTRMKYFVNCKNKAGDTTILTAGG